MGRERAAGEKRLRKARISGVVRLSRRWLIPEDAVLPPELEYAASKCGISA